MGHHLICYARVSIGEQNPGLQLDALTAAGCTRVFSDTAFGALDKRSQLDALLDYVCPGDVLVVWRLDRLGRSVRHLTETVNILAGGPLRRWGHARARDVRDSGSTTLTLRPRRARCSSCGGTHVLLLGAVLPRRADTTAVIGTALQASARGIGYRRIATQLGRPASTVRRWVRAVRQDHHVDWLREQGIGWIAQLDREVLATLAAGSTRLGEALTAIGDRIQAARARRRMTQTELAQRVGRTRSSIANIEGGDSAQ